MTEDQHNFDRKAQWQTPELSRFAEQVASLLTENPSMVALRSRLSEDLRRSINLDQLASQMAHDVAAGGALSDLQAQLTSQLREQFSGSPVLRRFQRELSASLRLDPRFTDSVRELLGPRVVPVARWGSLLQELRQGTGVDTEPVEQELRSTAEGELSADEQDEQNWLLSLSRAQRAALALAVTELVWAISQVAVASTSGKEASAQMQYGAQALFALLAVLVVLMTPDDS